MISGSMYVFLNVFILYSLYMWYGWALVSEGVSASFIILRIGADKNVQSFLHSTQKWVKDEAFGLVIACPPSPKHRTIPINTLHALALEPSICWCCEISTFCREDLVRTNSCTWRSCHSLICVVVSELRVQVDADLGFSILILSWCCLRLASAT